MTPAPDAPEDLRDREQALRSAGVRPEAQAWQLLTLVERDAASFERIRQLSQTGDDRTERLLLWHAAQQALPKLASLRIPESVRKFLDQDLQSIHIQKTPLEAGSYGFDRSARLATLRRFPAGAMEWEVSGIPRSWFLEAGLTTGLFLLCRVLFGLGGLSPYLFMHVAPPPRGRGLVMAGQVMRSWYRIVKALEMQPEMKGILAHAWFLDPAALADSPNLEPLNRPFTKEGGFLVRLGPAPADSGVLVGNAQRKADYLAGKVQYHYGLGIWPRKAALEWAARHPELAD